MTTNQLYSSYSQSGLSSTIFEELNFCSLFKVDEAQVQPVKAYFVVEMIKFVCCGIEPNLGVKISQNLKVYLSARTHYLIKDHKSLKRQIILNIVKGQLLNLSTCISVPKLLETAAKFVSCNRCKLFGSTQWNKLIKNNPQALEAIIQFGI